MRRKRRSHNCTSASLTALAFVLIIVSNAIRLRADGRVAKLPCLLMCPSRRI
jgi:hypothetical protein